MTAWYLLAPDTIDEMMAEVLGAQAQPDQRDHRRSGARRGARGRHGGARAARPALPAPARRRLRWRRPPARGRRELRGALLVSGRGRSRVACRATSPVDPPTGATSPATIPSWPAAAARGRRGGRRPLPRGGARHEDGRPAGRSSCGATRTTPTIRTRWRCTPPRGGEPVGGFVPRELAAELAPELDEGDRGRRSACASSGAPPGSRAPGSRCCSDGRGDRAARGQSRPATLSLTAWIWRCP